jgi:hypothetical protein
MQSPVLHHPDVGLGFAERRGDIPGIQLFQWVRL